MKFLIDVNVPRAIVLSLRSLGHDVEWALDQMAQDEDFEILAAAQTEESIVLTSDKDFGELSVFRGLPASSGVILLRLGGASLEKVVARAVEAISSRTDWAGHISVIDFRKVRMRPLPASGFP